MIPFPACTYTGVLVHRRDLVFVSSVSDELSDRNIDHAAILRWHHGGWAHRTTNVAVRGMVALEGPKLTLLNMGVDGTMIEFTFPGEHVESVDESDDGPSDLVHLRSMRKCGDHIYVAGMARRVYRRDGPGQWTAIDAGVFAPRTASDRAVGFNAIDGLSDEAIYAVGYGGEVWRYDGHGWRQEEQVTNVTLSCVRCLDSRTAFAAGSAGVVLRALDDNWEPLQNHVTDTDFWGMTLFLGRLYLAGYAGLFVVDGNAVLPVDMNLPQQPSTSYLDASDGVMWSVGQKHLFYTADGVTWTEVSGPS